MSYINTTYNSITRMTGLSGLDVDSLVYQLMQIERTKVDSVSKSRQLLVWKQEQYREITSALQSFSNEYLNSLKAATDMRNSSVYSAFAVKYNGQDTNSYFTVSAGSGARAGNYTISNITTAKTAKIAGSAAADVITGKALTEADFKSLAGGTVSVEFNGVKKDITLSDGISNAADLASELQTKLNAAFGSGKITVNAEAGALKITTDYTNTVTFSGTTNGGYNAILNSDLSNGITITEQNNKFRVKLGGTEKVITLDAGTKYNDASEVASAIQNLVDNEFGSGRIKVDVKDNKIVIESENPDTELSVSAVDYLQSIGLSSSNNSNKVNLSANIYDIRDSFEKPLTVTGSENDISFVINGQTFTFNSATTSISKIMAAVNSNTDAGVKMSYDSLNNRFILESRQTGSAASITVSDLSGGFMNSLGLIPADGVARGSDASITYSDGEKTHTITRSTNSFTVDGMTFNLQKDFAGSVDLSVTSDPTKAVELIKGFVQKYNELLDKVNTKLSEEREYAYEPLTDDQKDAMKEDEIKKWEEKAKSGLLNGDSILQSIVYGLRNAVIESVEGTGLTLASIGIKSNSWADKGKLYIDEEKLKSALTENPTAVIDLFTKQSDVMYSTAATNGTARSERFKENGIIYRIYDVIQDNIRTTTIDGRRGALLEKAGMIGDRSLYNNTLYNQIVDYDKKIDRLNELLIDKENHYYQQFAQLETLINNMNTQSTWLAQQFMR